MVPRCGSLKQVNEDIKLSRAVRPTPDGGTRQGSTSNLNKRSRKPRSKRAFKSIATGYNHDPLSLVGSEFLVREYPLAVLECRDRRYSHTPTARRGRNNNTPRGEDQTISVADGEEDEERLAHLQTLIYGNNSERRLSESTKSSIRKRGLDKIGSILHSASSSLSSSKHNHTTQQQEKHIHINKSHGQQNAQRQKILRKIHGKHRRTPHPSCPNCSGALTYLYIHISSVSSPKNNHHTTTNTNTITVRELHNKGNENENNENDVSTTMKEKYQNLLPPLCIHCRTHLLFEHAPCRFIMMENFEKWLESSGGFDGEVGYNFNDPKFAKIIVVNSTPTVESSAVDNAREDDDAQNRNVPLATALSSFEEPTPRLRNSSRSVERPSSRFRFDETSIDEMMMRGDDLGENPIFSGISSLSDGINRRYYRRKGDVCYEHIKVIGGDEQEQQKKGEVSNDNRREDEINESSHTQVPSSHSPANDSNVTSPFENATEYYSSDDDPFSALQDDDAESDGDCSGNQEDADQQRDELQVKEGIVEECPSTTSLPSHAQQVLANKSSGSIKLIHTESEERKILERYSMKKEVATKQIAKDLIRGHELTTSECDVCKMPMMKKDGDTIESCVACPAIQRKAKRIAKHKRKKIIESSKSEECKFVLLTDVNGENKDDVMAATKESAGVIEELDFILGIATDQKDGNSHSCNTEELVELDHILFGGRSEQKDDIDGGDPSVFEYKLSKDTESLAILEETRNLNALEEGRFLGTNSSGHSVSGPFQFLGDCSEPVNYGSYGENNAAGGHPITNAPSWNRQYSSSSIGLNSNKVVLPVTASNQSDYWIRHSSSRLNTPAPAQISAAPSASHSKCPNIKHQGSAAEHSLSSYQSSSIQQQNQQNVMTTVGDQLYHSHSSNPCQEPISSSYNSVAPSSHSYHPNIKHQRSAAEHSLSSYQSRSIQRHQKHVMTTVGDQLYHSHSNPHQESISGVSARPQISAAPSSHSYHPNIKRQRSAAEHSISSYQSSSIQQQHQQHVITAVGDQLYHSHSNPYQESMSEVSERQVSSDASSTRCPHNLPSSEMIHSQHQSIASTYQSSSIQQHQQHVITAVGDQLYHSHSNPYQESISEVSERQVSSEVSSTRCPRNLPSSEMIHHQHQLIASTEAGGHLYHSHSNPQGSISEVSDHQGPSMVSNTPPSRDLPPSEMMIQKNQRHVAVESGSQLSHSYSYSNQYQESSEVTANQGFSEISSTQCPRNLPSSEMLHRRYPPNATAEAAKQFYHSHSNPYEGSLSKASGHRESSMRAENHHTATEAGNHLYHSSSIQHQGSISEASERQGSSVAPESQCRRNSSSSEMIYEQYQQSATTAAEDQLCQSRSHQCQGSSSEVSELHMSSEESSTRCPRDLPSNQKIWHYKSCDGSQPFHVYPVQSIASESIARRSSSDLDQVSKSSVDKGQHALPSQALRGIVDVDSWRDHPKDRRCHDPQKSLSGNSGGKFEDQGNANLQATDSELYKDACEDVGVCTNKYLHDSETECVLECHPPHELACLERRRNDDVIPSNVHSESNVRSQILTRAGVVGRDADDCRIEENYDSLQMHEHREERSDLSQVHSQATYGKETQTDQQPKDDWYNGEEPSELSQVHDPSTYTNGTETQTDQPLKDCCYNHSTSSSNANTTDGHSRTDPPHGRVEESLSDRISRLADSLREVADQLPLKDDYLPSTVASKENTESSDADENDGSLMIPTHSYPQSNSQNEKDHLVEPEKVRNRDQIFSICKRDDSAEGIEQCHKTYSSVTGLDLCPKENNKKVLETNYPLHPTSSLSAKDEDQAKENAVPANVFGNEFDATNNSYPLHQNNTLTERENTHPFPFIVRDHSYRYEGIHPPLRGFKRTGSLPSVALTSGVQPHISFLQHESYKPESMPALRGSNRIGIPISPITVGKEENQLHIFHDHDHDRNKMPSPNERQMHKFTPQPCDQSSPREQRADPPGHRMQSYHSETRDPPDDDSQDYPLINVTPKSRSKLPRNMKMLHDHSPNDQRHQTNRDPPSEISVDAMHPIRSVHNSITPKSKAWRRPCDKKEGTSSAGVDKFNDVSLAESKVAFAAAAFSNDRHCIDKEENNFKDVSSSTPLQKEGTQINVTYCEADEVAAPLQTASSWGDSSLDKLFQQIDEIEDDFNTIVASMPSSEGQTTISLKSSEGETESLKSTNEKHSLVEITLNNAGSFESNASEDSVMADVVQRMRRIRDYIEQVDSVDEGDGSDADGGDSQSEMSELIQRLTNAAESLRAFNEWDD